MTKKPSRHPDDSDDAPAGQSHAEVLLRVARGLSASHSVQDFLDRSVRNVSRATGVAHVKVLRYRPDKGDLLIIAGVGWRDDVVGKTSLPIGTASPPGRAIQTGQPVVIEDLPNNKEFQYSDFLREHGIVSVINAPVMVDSEPWGVLEIDGQDPSFISRDTILFIHTVGYLLGAAVRREQQLTEASSARAAVAQEADRREMLLREMHHRVKNNFHIIVSMLLLQQRRTTHEETKAVLRDMTDKIMAVALAHDQLDPKQGLQRINLAQYLRALCRTIDQFAADVSLQMDLDEATVGTDTAVSLGLITNELVTNALKHAFDGEGTIRVEYRANVGKYEACLSVSDDGKGIAESKAKGGSGRSLVDALADQLQGRVERESSGTGTTVRIIFPAPGK